MTVELMQGIFSQIMLYIKSLPDAKDYSNVSCYIDYPEAGMGGGNFSFTVEARKEKGSDKPFDLRYQVIVSEDRRG